PPGQSPRFGRPCAEESRYVWRNNPPHAREKADVRGGNRFAGIHACPEIAAPYRSTGSLRAVGATSLCVRSSSMAYLDRKRLVGEMAERYGIRLDDSDPALAIIS